MHSTAAFVVQPTGKAVAGLRLQSASVGMVLISNRLSFTGHFWQQSVGFSGHSDESVLKLAFVVSVAIFSLIPTRNILSNVCCFDTFKSAPGTKSPILTSARITGHVIFSCGSGGDGGLVVGGLVVGGLVIGGLVVGGLVGGCL